MTDMATGPVSPPPPRNERLHATAVALETEFLTEMLKSTGLSKGGGSMSGGIGEDQFSSLLVREQAGLMARSGGVGLAESIYIALTRSGAHEE